MKKISIIAFAALAFLLASCDKFLDVMPDNRAEITSEEKIKSLLTSAYPDHDYVMVAEMLSDDVDKFNNTYVTSQFFEQLWHWQDITESNNESPENIWTACYGSIASANHALQAIEEVVAENGGEWTESLKQEKAEALVCRAYNHFILVNMFCLNYNPATSGKDLGIPYATEPETTLAPVYERGTVEHVYKMIDKDLQEALPEISESYYSVPKYHFNPKAAYAFASRFYLYYEKWDECIKYADLVLGTAPATMLRDYKVLAENSTSQAAAGNVYISADINTNLLLLTAYSTLGTTFGAYTTNKKFAHGNYVSEHETGKATQVWASANGYIAPMRSYAGTNRQYVIFWRLPHLFEYTDPVAGTGYSRAVYPAFTCDECLLNRAEAYILKKDYAKALEDLNLWTVNCVADPVTLTTDLVQEFYNGIVYSYSDSEGMISTQKKHLNPAFAIEEEGSVQETMLQCVLGMRRIETMPMGIRWFDVKRYGIEIVRREMDAQGIPAVLIDVLKKDDPRRAIQLPNRVISAGMTPNPRNK
ncbi:MAG: RagB/SusD family nutrient uptake outer membrane protein [Bacteroidales bacterium]|nr:RagB/SusD family nutrient uptake outer membrane protein [Bacteroidales bacterium]